MRISAFVIARTVLTACIAGSKGRTKQSKTEIASPLTSTPSMSRTRNDGGAILISTFIVMATLTAITAGFLALQSVQMKSTGSDVVSHEALWLAEAGLQQTIYKIKSDSNYQSNPTTVSGSLANGTYSVSVTKNGSNYSLDSTGTAGGFSRRITETVTTGVGAIPAFSYLQQVGGEIDFDNSSGTVTGDISAGEEVENEEGMTITGTVIEDSTVATPTVNSASYQAIADTVVTGNKTFSAAQTLSGIWYVTGNVTIQSGVTINGSVVAEGNITVSSGASNVSIHPAAGYPALVAGATGSNKDISANRQTLLNISGLIYASRDITLDRNTGTIFNGTMIAGRDLSIKRGSGLVLTFNSGILSNPPPYFSSTDSSVSVTEQKDWNEIVPA